MIKPVSILIAAFNSAQYLTHCVSSICGQSYFKNNNQYEVLIGVDGCVKTLEVAKLIQKSFNNIRVFWMPENKGTYMTLNALLDKAKYENIIVFGSDDIMGAHMVEELTKHEVDMIRSRFYLASEKSLGESKSYSWGCIWVKRWVYDLAGGYEPWICSADRDLIYRVQNKVTIRCIPDRLFYYRRHNESMTGKNSANSALRKAMHLKIAENINNKVLTIPRKSNVITDEY